MKRLLLATAAVALFACAPARAEDGVDQLLLPNQSAAPSVPNPLQQPGQGQPGRIQPGQVAPGVAVAPNPMESTPDNAEARYQHEHDAAFTRALREASPMSPGEIRRYRQTLDGARKATVEPLAPTRAVTRMVSLSLKPGEPSPILHVQPRFVTSTTFSDATGKPWPVLSVVTGDPTGFVAQSAGAEGKSNVIVVSATAEHLESNLVVTLVNHPVPITIRLVPDSPETDYRVDFRIEARGPNAAADIVGVSSLSPTSDSTMIDFLDGVAPDGAKALKSTSDRVEAWKFEDLLYIRTRGEVMSPAYTARSSNVSGVNVFQMPWSPVLIISADGRVSHVHIDR